jgi:hypothetical protein
MALLDPSTHFRPPLTSCARGSVSPQIYIFLAGMYNDRTDHKYQIRIVIRYLEVQHLVYYEFT